MKHFIKFNHSFNSDNYLVINCKNRTSNLTKYIGMILMREKYLNYTKQACRSATIDSSLDSLRCLNLCIMKLTLRPDNWFHFILLSFYIYISCTNKEAGLFIFLSRPIILFREYKGQNISHIMHINFSF